MRLDYILDIIYIYIVSVCDALVNQHITFFFLFFFGES